MPGKHRGFSPSICLVMRVEEGLSWRRLVGSLCLQLIALLATECRKFRLLYLSQEQEGPFLCHLVRFCSPPRVQLKHKLFPTWVSWPGQTTPLSSGLGGTLATHLHNPHGTPLPRNSDVCCPTPVPDNVWVPADLSAAYTCLRTASRVDK